MPTDISAKTRLFTESVIREMTRRALKCGAVNLAQGFPDFAAPAEIKEAAKRAIDEEYNQYAITHGSPNFRRAIADKVCSYNGFPCDPDRNITVTCGATEAMIATMLAVGRGMRRHDVRRLAALGDDAMDAIGFVDMLPQESNRGLGDSQRVGGVDAELGERGGVRFLAGIEHVEHRGGDYVRRRHIDGRRMDHHGGVNPAKAAALEHQDFPARIADFLARSAEQRKRKSDLIGNLRRSDRGTDTARRDDVVAAGVADARQAIVFRANRNVQGSRARPRDKGRRHIAGASFHGEARIRQGFADPLGRTLFLKAQFRMRMNPMTQLDQVPLSGIEPFARSIFRIHVRSSAWSSQLFARDHL
jgi:hypothetical protein